MNDHKTGSIRSFGIVFFFVFIIIALYPLLNDHEIRIWSLIVAFIFICLGIFNSPLLKPLNLIWFKLGFFLGKFISPLVMGVVYFFVVFPTFILLKLFKRNYLNIKYDKDVITYWIDVKNNKSSMEEQF